ncbi:MAG: hypothetical protein B9S34_14785 [Opitutia bacterium Tous-C1TDCM]|nr:MAG: hypothetical protein B9S34_14785 [Opitutae bacterium Tous-C1TDCM]
MKIRLVSLLAFAGATAFAADPGFKSIFNGKDLSGWDGNKSVWSVKDGALTGQTTPEKTIKANTFLVYQDAQPANFELRLSFKLTAQNDKNQANSGVQYRSKVMDPATFVVGGYQADIDSTGKYAGMLYEEKGRGILMGPGEKVKLGETTMVPDPKKKDGKRSQTAVVKLPGATPPAEILAAYKLGEWNDLVIIANGNRLQHFLNGKLTAEVTDTDATRAPKSGVIALQLHVGPPMTVQFKNVQLKTLP